MASSVFNFFGFKVIIALRKHSVVCETQTSFASSGVFSIISTNALNATGNFSGKLNSAMEFRVFCPKCFDYKMWTIQVHLYFTLSSALLSFSRKFSLISEFLYFYCQSICGLVCSFIMLVPKSFKDAILSEPGGGNGMSLDTNPPINVVVPDSSMAGYPMFLVLLSWV